MDWLGPVGATCKVGHVLRSLVSFKTILKPLKMRLIKLMFYLHEGLDVGRGFPLREGYGRGCDPFPENFSTSE